MELESLKELREYTWHERFAELADKIQDEVDERYMPLPLDRKGEPWHLGDEFPFMDAGGKKHVCTVSGIGDGEVFFYYDEHADSSKHRHYRASVIAHCRPRTVEDVLWECSKEYVDWLEYSGPVGDCQTLNEIFAKYAAELQMREGDVE
jgi:hypothetical protein